MSVIRAAGRDLTVGDLPTSRIVMAHGLPVGCVEIGIGGAVLLDDDLDSEEKDQALGDLLDFVKRPSTGTAMKLAEARREAAELTEEYGA